MSHAISKQKVYEMLIEEINQVIDRLTKVYETTSDAAVKAQGRMESRYDTTKEEQSKLADAIGMQVYEHRKRLKSLQYFWSITTKNVGTVIGPGSLVIVEADNQEEVYFIIESGSGYVFELEGCEIVCISVQTPLAQSLTGHKQGEVVEVIVGGEKRLLTIKSLQ